ncbi:unnamed protein product, partial [Musa hybrid cultivar]
ADPLSLSLRSLHTVFGRFLRPRTPENINWSCEFDLAFLRFAPAAPGFEPGRRNPSAPPLRPTLWAPERRAMAAELGQQTVEFSALVRRAAEDSYLALKELVERSRAPEDQRSDSEKKIDLLKFIAKTRQRMLRLHVLAKWCRQAKFKINAIRFELISDGTAAQGANTSALQLAQDGELDSTGLKTPGLKIIYWLGADKNAGGSDFSSRPFLKLEPGKDTQIKCLHNSFVLDPLTGKEAIFSLDQSCIDLEKLLLKAIACNIHTRLFEIQRELSKSVNICR